MAHNGKNYLNEPFYYRQCVVTEALTGMLVPHMVHVGQFALLDMLSDSSIRASIAAYNALGVGKPKTVTEAHKRKRSRPRNG